MKARLQSFGSVWALYFTDKPVRNYRDLLPLRSGAMAALRATFRQHMMQRGIVINAHAGNRSFLSAAHSNDDVVKVVEAIDQFFADHRAELN